MHSYRDIVQRKGDSGSWYHFCRFLRFDFISPLRMAFSHSTLLQDLKRFIIWLLKALLENIDLNQIKLLFSNTHFGQIKGIPNHPGLRNNQCRSELVTSVGHM